MEKKITMKKEEKDTLQLVLQEILEGQTANTQTIRDLVTATNKTGEKLADPPPVEAVADLGPVKELLEKWFTRIQLRLDVGPRPITRKLQILLFPPQDARLFYRIVFSRWLLLLVIAMAIHRVYLWGVHYSDNRMLIEQEQLENNRIKKAWHYLYTHEDKHVQTLMDSAYVKSGRETLENGQKKSP